MTDRMRDFRPTASVALALVALTSGCSSGDRQGPPSGETPSPLQSGSLVDLASGTQERLQAIDAGDGVVLWASGVGGTVVRSVDGGASWRLLPVEGAADLELRDVEAFGAERAFALAAGPGEQSRILATVDGGETWTERWRNPEPEAFYDCFDFWPDGRGIAFSDSVGNRLLLAVTDDGATWRAGPFGPPALEGEGGFAASGTCLITGDAGRAWIGTGAGGVARLFATEDFGASWQAFETPVSAGGVSAGGAAAGILSLARDESGALYAFGGDIADAESRGGRIASSGDGGRSWGPTPLEPAFAGAIYAGAARGGGEGAELLAVGPGGAAYSPDAGATWIGIDERSWWSVAWTPMGDAILAGPEGRLARWSPDRE